MQIIWNGRLGGGFKFTAKRAGGGFFYLILILKSWKNCPKMNFWYKKDML